MEEMLNEILKEIKGVKNEFNEYKQEVNKRFDTLQSDVTKANQSLARIEQDHGSKITALFDGYSLRGDQIQHLQEHLDDRLDAVQTDLSYVVSKIAQHDRNIVRLNKKTSSK